MIKFFRKIRKKLLTENKFSKYLVYAIGEVFLVVIGILIALWINNNNQEQIQKKKIDAILIKIQNDILQDIYQGEWLISGYMRKDSISDLIMGGKLTPEDVKKNIYHNKSFLTNVTEWSSNYTLQSSGYNQLISILDVLPEKYDNLIRGLNYRHTNLQQKFDRINKDSRDLVSNYQSYLEKEQSWWTTDQYNRKLSDAQIDYILYNPRFKGQMTRLLNFTKALVTKYTLERKDAINGYFAINELLGENARALPEKIRKTSVANETEADRLIGTYKLISGPEDTKMGKMLEVYKKGKNLYLKTANESKIGPLMNVHIKRQRFTYVGSRQRILCFEYSGKNTLYIVNSDFDQGHWLKE